MSVGLGRYNGSDTMMRDDLLGQQQDELARLRYELAKTLEGADDFQGCKTAMGVYRRLLELDEEHSLRNELRRSLEQLRPQLRCRTLG